MSKPLPLEYPDLVYTSDLDPLASETSTTLQNLAQDILHLLEEDLGSNLDDPTRGIGVYNYLNGTQNNIVLLPAIVTQQLNQDSRVSDSACALTDNGDGTWLITITISVADTVVPIQYAWDAQNGVQLANAWGL